MGNRVEPQEISSMSCPRCYHETEEFHNHKLGDVFECPQCGKKLCYQEDSGGSWIAVPG